MRRAVAPSLARKARSPMRAVPATIPAPVAGLDTQSPLAAMPETSAIILDNWIPRASYVEMRRGFRPFATGLDGPVETLISWRGPTSVKLFAAANAKLYDITAGGAVGSPAVTGLTNARWNYVNVTTGGGSFVVAVNGAATPRSYNGSTWATLTITGSGLDPALLVDVVAHHHRLFFIERDTMRLWFLAPGAIQGAAGLFELGEVFSQGGSLLAIGTWSSDAGTSLASRLVLVTTQGEVAVFEGIDPSDAALWSLVGVYRIPMPIGRRCLVKNGSDLGILTGGGLLPLSQVLTLDRAVQGRVAFTQNIANTFQQRAASFGSLNGWHVLSWPRGQLVIVNVPRVTNGEAEQLVMDTVTGAWARWTGMPAICWAAHNERLFFGDGGGRVLEAGVGWADDAAPITADVQTAFTYLGRRGQLKQFGLLRPLLRATQTLRPSVELLVDFENRIPASVPTTVIDQASLWDVAQWDTALWSSDLNVRRDWTGCGGIGSAASVRLRMTTFGESDDAAIQLVGFDLAYMAGGIL